MSAAANSCSPAIRLLEHHDLEPVARLFHADMLTLGANTPLASLQTLLASVLDDDGQTCRCWLATRTPASRRPLGAILVNFYRSVKFGGRSLWIEELYVDTEQRRAGVGRALVEHVIAWAAANDFLGIDLEAYQTNTPAAILYRTLGFSRLGRARFSLDFDDYDRED